MAASRAINAGSAVSTTAKPPVPSTRPTNCKNLVPSAGDHLPKTCRDRSWTSSVALERGSQEKDVLHADLRREPAESSPAVRSLRDVTQAPTRLIVTAVPRPSRDENQATATARSVILDQQRKDVRRPHRKPGPNHCGRNASEIPHRRPSPCSGWHRPGESGPANRTTQSYRCRSPRRGHECHPWQCWTTPADSRRGGPHMSAHRQSHATSGM
jgi:hypothetical protein